MNYRLRDLSASMSGESRVAQVLIEHQRTEAQRAVAATQVMIDAAEAAGNFARVGELCRVLGLQRAAADRAQARAAS